MVTDLPDYTRKIVVVYESLIDAGMVKVDHRQIKGLTLKDPYVPLAVPMSVENPALAYDAVNDRFKIDIEALTVGVIPVSFTSDWDTILGKIDLAKTLGATIAHSNPLITRLSNGTTWIDPRDRSWTITEELKRDWTLGDSDIPDLKSKASRLLGIVYGDKGQLQQRTTTLELLVQLMNDGSEINPTAIRALTSSDVVTAQQTTRTSMTVKPEREDLISLGGVASPSAAGVQIVAPNGTKKPKVYDCEYEVLAAGLHYFYFGTTTTPTTKRFLTRQTVGVNSKSFVQPRVGEAGDGIYLYSAVAETNMPYDIGYVLE